ncbi:hypothetical protein Hanom_Chr01g00021861 [Helianthus anomalus]
MIFQYFQMKSQLVRPPLQIFRKLIMSTIYDNRSFKIHVWLRRFDIHFAF